MHPIVKQLICGSDTYVPESREALQEAPRVSCLGIHGLASVVPNSRDRPATPSDLPRPPSKPIKARNGRSTAQVDFRSSVILVELQEHGDPFSSVVLQLCFSPRRLLGVMSITSLLALSCGLAEHRYQRAHFRLGKSRPRHHDRDHYYCSSIPYFSIVLLFLFNMTAPPSKY